MTDDTYSEGDAPFDFSPFILRGWRRITSGLAYGGDRYFDIERVAWLPVTVNQHTTVENYIAVIRKGKN
jgi:hypothetical protein